MCSIIDEAVGRLYEVGKPVPDSRKLAHGAEDQEKPPPDTVSGRVGGVESAVIAVGGGSTDKPRTLSLSIPRL